MTGPPRRLEERVAAQAARTPGATALIAGEERWSYRDLDEWAARVAARLHAAGVGAPGQQAGGAATAGGDGGEPRVGILLRRRPAMVAAILGALKAGAAYLPLDPAYPPERLRFMLADSGARWLATEEALAGLLPAGEVEPVALDGGPDALPPPPPPSLPARTHAGGADRLAYLIYTSGSTGRPKGVAIAHRSASVFLDWALGVFSAGELAGVLASTSICFDLAIFELFVTLAGGGTVVLAADALELPRLPAAGEVRTVNSVPAAMTELLRGGGLPPSVTTVNLAGEPLRRELVERIYALGHVERVYNLYGPSEDTTYSTWSLVEPGAELPVTIGRPIAGTRAAVVDRRSRPVAGGDAGELLLGGAGLARGYLGRPALTAERFVPDPFGSEPGGRLYRTGDLVRELADGRLDFLGRLDHQVKLRGFRIELGEVEAALARQPGVAEAVAAVREDLPGDRRLVAYWTAAAGFADAAPASPELRRRLEWSLPSYMVPSRLVRLEAMPRTPNGKVDRKALPVPEGVRPELTAPYRQPATALERDLAAIWAELLALDRVGADDDLFELGGHSLLATRIAARLRELHGVDLAPTALFEQPTVARLAAAIEGRGTAAPQPLPRPVWVPRDGRLPLAFPQEQVWVINQLVPGNLAYNFQYTIRFRGPLSVPRLAATLAEIVRRHEVLRTTFPAVDGEPCQLIHPPWRVRLPVADLSALPAERRGEAAERALALRVRRRFDVTALPLLEWTVLRLGDDDHLFVHVEHHFVHDGWSIAVIVGEMAAIYAASAAGEPSPLPELPVQFADFAVWQRRWLAGEVLERQLDYWRGALAAPPPALELPTDRPRRREQSFRGDRLDVELPPDLYAAARECGRRAGFTLFMTLLAAFQVLVHRYSGRRDFLLGSGVANRRLREFETLIGMVVNTLVLRADLGGKPTFRELLGRVRRSVLGMQEHQDLPFETLVAALAPDRDLSRNPLFQHMFSFHDAPVPDVRFAGLTGELVERHNGSAKSDWNVIVKPRGEQRVGRVASAEDDLLRVLWEFSTDLFDRATIERAWGHYRVLLAAAVADPDRPVSALPLLSAAEESQLAAWNATAVPPPEGWGTAAAHELFEARADADPDAPAVVAGDRRLGYGELEARANRLARLLAGRGVGPESRVGVCLPSSPELVVAVLAVLKAGGAYLPLDPAHPAERVAYTLDDAGAALVLTLGSLVPLVTAGGDGAGGARPVLALDAPGLLDAGPAVRPPRRARPANLAYVIYTSGSTGRPKGTELTHAGLVNLIAWHLRVHRLAAGERTTQIASPAFDASVWEIWPALAAGAALHLPPAALRSDPAALGRWLAAERIDLAFLPTPLAEALVAEEPPAGLALRALLTGGDRLHRPPRRGSPYRLVNHYGPTEVTVVTTAGEVSPDAAGRAPAIGRPIDNLRVHLVERSLAPVPVGVPGELCVAGVGLARGYLGRPALTAERFVPDPFAGPQAPGARLYRTGDLARRLPDGRIDFLGRADGQVKVRGFRIELGEIEAVLAAHPAVARAAVVAAADREHLTAFVVGAGDPPWPADPAALRAHLAARLPEYMVPAAFVSLAALPLAATGKVDRRALAERAAAPAEGGAAGDGSAARGTPRTPTEELLAGIFSEVLGGVEVGIDDDFFALGGHSLRATRAVSRVRSLFGVELPLPELFERPTVAGLAARIDGRLRAGGPADGGGAAVPLAGAAARRGGPPPLSFAQQRLWFLDRLDPAAPTYNIARAFRLTPEAGERFEPAALAAALAALARRHAALRTAFPAEDGRPVQRIAPDPSLPLRVVDLTALPDADGGGGAPGGSAARSGPPSPRRREAGRLRRREARRPFRLDSGPLARAALLRLGWLDPGGGEDALLLTLHHAVADGWSMAILFAELSALYRAARAARARAADRRPPLPPLPVQVADHAVWQRERLAGERLEALVAYWRERLAGAPPASELPTDRPRPPLRGADGRRVVRPLPAGLAAELRRLGARLGATPFMVGLAAFAALLGRAAGAREVVVGTPIAGRTVREVEGLIGFFVNTLAVRVDLAGDPSFAGLVARVRAGALGAYAHQELPFEVLVDRLAPDRTLSRSPLFQVLFAVHNAPVEPLALAGVAVEPLAADWVPAHFDVSLTLEEGGDGGGAVAQSLIYDVGLYDATTAERLLRRYEAVLAAAVAVPERAISSLPFAPAAERHQVLVEWSADPDLPGGAGEAAPGPERLEELVFAQARRTPDAVAVAAGGVHLSYGELARRAGGLAERLAALGVGAETPVAVALRRTPELPLALLGVLAAGGAYVPLDPAYPAERIATTLADSGAPLVVTEPAVAAAGGALRPAMEACGCRAVFLGDAGPVDLTGAGPRLASPGGAADLDAAAELIGAQSPARLAVGLSGAGPRLASPDGAADLDATAGSIGAPSPARQPPSGAGGLAYLIYTSGSTGRPKGVAITHRNAVARLRWAGCRYAADELASVFAATSICFDLSVFEIFAPLAWGGRVVVGEDALALRSEPEAFAVTLVNTVPSAMAELVRPGSPAGVPPSAAVVNLAGEPLKRPLVAALHRLGTVRRVHNLYGPSEDTTYSTGEAVRPGAEPTLGRPLPGTAVHLLDRRLAPVPRGSAGELCLSGAGLSRGYHRRPALTAERYAPDPFGPPGSRLYRTGDLARWRADGRLEFLGRIDHQVKLRGYRIELGEIETALAAHPAVAEAVVVVEPGRDDGAGTPRLIAYSVPAAPGSPAGAGDLRAHLGGRLPAYMVPAVFVSLAALPRTPNGKIDRRALPAPDGDRGAAGGDFVAPRSPAEERVAAIWRELLTLERVGVHDDFFALGGHSLLVVQVVSRMRRAFGVDLPERSLFLAPTVAGLAAEVERAAAAGGGGGGGPIARAPREARRRKLADLRRPG